MVFKDKHIFYQVGPKKGINHKGADNFHELKSRSKRKEALQILELFTDEITWRYNHKKSASTKQRYLRKLDVIIRLGGECKTCGETDPDLLCIDHINEDGHLERHNIKTNGRSFDIITEILKMYRRGEHPELKYQLLCYNDNMLKHLYLVTLK